MKESKLRRKTWYIFTDCLGSDTILFVRSREEKTQAAKMAAAWHTAMNRGTSSRFYQVYARTAYSVMRAGCTVRSFSVFRHHLVFILNDWKAMPRE